ncbi:hypothetical protein CYL18_14775 [Pradoshia eiseniae]|uniref:PD-(D/E)XK endonuclease-like domain-containing protein n=2 Tax=Pradoshia eiseniae TaxID=2064768 RepID=A0A2S7MX21_9BACI|nr:hypothetical protein CYL18_14775 [Pradoshia eiseniae]
MWSQSVLTYATVDQLFEPQSLFHDYSDVLHITATSTLRSGITMYMAEDNRLITAPILTFAQILSMVGCDISKSNSYDTWPWYSSKTQLKQYTLISQVLREINEENTHENPKIYNAVTKNKDVLLRTLRMFIEAGETSKTVKQKLGQSVVYEERLALKVWEKLEQDDTYKAFENWGRQLQASNTKNIENMFIKIFCDLLYQDSERQSANILPIAGDMEEGQLFTVASKLARKYISNKRIVLHGFYFITPIQQRIIDALQAAGFEIIHLINYQHEYKKVFEVVDVFLEKEQNKFMPVSKRRPFLNKIAQKFLYICEGNFELDLTDMPDKYLEFNHMYQFKQYIQNEMRSEKEVHDFIISPRAREVRSQVEDMGTLRQLTLKDYPIGQFLLDLHSLSITTFNEETEQFIDREELSVDILMRIFSLGYIHVQDISSRYLVRDLSKLRERLVGKVSFAEWKQEIMSIMKEKQLLEEALTPDNVKVTDDNEVYIYKNRILSYYDITFENLERIYEVLKAIEKLYEDIFSSESTIQVKDYVIRLVEHLNEEIIPKIEIEEEINVAQELLRVFEDMGNSDFDNFDRQDLIQGLRFFLSEELANNDNSLFGESLIDSKIVSLQDGDILPFIENQSVHLAFLDNKALPLSQNLVTWPFNSNSMDILYKKAPEHQGQYIHFIQRRKIYDAAITKYLLYVIMLNASSIKFSIVTNLGSEHGLKRSFYLDLLDLTEASEKAKENADVHALSGIDYEEVEIEVNKPKVTPLVEFTRKYCKKRMVLSYMLQKTPSFETNYHHRYIYEKLISQLNYFTNNKQGNLSKEDIRALVSSMYPHWSDTKKRILAERGEGWNYQTGELLINGIRFADNLKQLHLFGKEVTESNQFANAGSHCKYCPFQDRCHESEFSRDE